MKRSTGTMFSSRAVFLLGTLFALVGTGDASVSSCTGATSKFNTENNPGGTGVVACKCVLGYTAASASIVLGDVTLDCTKCAVGYYLSTADSTTAGAVCTQVPAGKFGGSTKDLTTVANAAVAGDAPASCPANSASVAGSTVMADCKLNAGYYITAKSSGTGTAPTPANVVKATTAGYAPGGLAIDAQLPVTDIGLTTCPYGGSTAVTGKSAQSDCTPLCGDTAVLKTLIQGGTCVCAATHYGVPVTAAGITTAVPTKGCTAAIAVGVAASTMDSTKFTIPGHPFVDGDAVKYNKVTTTALKLGGSDVAENTVLYIVGATATTFSLATAAGGSVVAHTAGDNDQTLTLAAGDCLGSSVTARATLSRKTTLADCMVTAGFYIETESTSASVEGSLAVSATPANYYAAGGEISSQQDDALVAATRTACPFGGTTARFMHIPALSAAQITANVMTFTAHGLSNGDQVRYNHASSAVTVSAATMASNAFTLAGHAFVDGDAVKYNKVGSTALTLAASAVSENTVLYIVGATATTFSVATAPGGAVVAHAAGDNTQTLTKAVQTNIANDLVVTVLAKTADTFKVALVATPATPIVLTRGNSAQYVTPMSKTLVTECIPAASIVIPALTAAQITANVMTFTAHGLSNGDEVTYKHGGGTVQTQISDGLKVYVMDKTANTFKVALAATRTTAIVLTTGNALQYFMVPSAGQCGLASVNAVSNAGTCQCKANYYGTPISAVAGSVATSGCTACPYGGASNAGSSAVTDCTPAASAATVNVTTALGTTVCKVGHYGSPTPTTTAATGGCIACPSGSTSVAGATVLSGCTVKAGFYIATKSTAVGAVTGLVISAVPADSYGLGGQQATQQVPATVLQTKKTCPFGGVSLAGSGFEEDCVPACGASGNATIARGTCICSANFYGAPLDASDALLAVATKGCTACPTNSESVAGTTTLAGCTVKAGFYIKTKSTSATVVGALSILTAPVNFYAVGGESASQQTPSDVTATSLACPHAGTTPATGKTKLTDCVPDCNTATYAPSVALGGTCVCKPTHYGAPTPTNAIPTTGCTVCTAGKYIQTAYTAATGGASSSGVAAASTSTADCVVQPGFYISGGSSSAGSLSALTVAQVAANSYSTAVAADIQAAEDKRLVCPYGGTTIQAANKLAGCTPSCGSGTNAVDVGGTCRCTSTHYGTPTDANGAQLATVTTGCTACPTNSATAYTAIAAPGGTIADCKVTAGYYLSVAKAGAATFGTITATPVNTWLAGGVTAVDGIAVVPNPCVVKSTSAIGSDSIDDCKVAGGYYLSVASPSATLSGRIAKSGVNSFAIGGRSISNTTAETSSSCTYAGTSAIGSDALADCTPSCGTVSVASSGTCACKAGRTGTPTPATSAVTGGCTATKCAVNKYVKANVCTTCPAGTTNAKDDDASGADTTCDSTKCLVNEYVKSNVCTACAAGTTNAKDDDASGADTVCGTVSSASRSDISFATIVMVIATLLACATV